MPLLHRRLSQTEEYCCWMVIALTLLPVRINVTVFIFSSLSLSLSLFLPPCISFPFFSYLSLHLCPLPFSPLSFSLSKTRSVPLIFSPCISLFCIVNVFHSSLFFLCFLGFLLSLFRQLCISLSPHTLIPSGLSLVLPFPPPLAPSLSLSHAEPAYFFLSCC